MYIYIYIRKRHSNAKHRDSAAVGDTSYIRAYKLAAMTLQFVTRPVDAKSR